MHLLIFPNQLFSKHPGLKNNPRKIVLIEDSLFFGDENYPARFHKQKLWLHRASMKRYELVLQKKGFETIYLDHNGAGDSLRLHLESLHKPKSLKPRRFETLEPVDFMLRKRLERFCRVLKTGIEFLPNPGFLNTPEQNKKYREGKKRWFMADFYKAQRRRLNILVDGEKEPVGGKWSFDEDNRKKVPKSKLNEIPGIPRTKHDEIDEEAKIHVGKHYATNPGVLQELYYPTSHRTATAWLKNFFESSIRRIWCL